MCLNLLVKDLNFIVYLWKWLNIFLITPWFDFNNNVFSNINVCKMFGLILILLKIYWVIDLVILDDTMEHTFQRLLFTQKLNYILSSMALSTITFLCITKSSLLINNNWKTFFINFKYIDVNLHHKRKIETKNWKNAYIHFFLWQIIFVISILYQMSVWSDLMKIPFFRGLWLGPAIDMFYEFQSIFSISFILICFKNRYKNLNMSLEQYNNNQIIVQKFQNLVYCHRILGENIDVFNSLYGYHILLILFHIGVQLVGCLNFPFAFLISSNFVVRIDVVISNFTVLSIVLVSNFY